MVVRRLSFHFGMLAVLLASSTGGLLCAQDGAVIISDEIADMNRPIWAEEEYSPDDVQPAQFQARSRSGGASSRTSTRQAGLSSNGQRNIQTSQLRLARAPKMMGDFYNLPGEMSIVGELFTGHGDHDGLAVHQSTNSSSAFANNNIAIIVTDSMTDKTVFLGGPGGLTPGTFFLPSIPDSQLQNPQTGLMLDGDDVDFYTAVLNGETANVFDNPGDTNPSIPNAPVYQVFQVSAVQLGGPNPGDFVGRVRVQDNNSAMPTDRIFLDYNYFHNVPFTANGIDVSRFTPGVEKTFLDGMGSVEVRVPMAVTFNSNQYLAVGPDTSEPEFGNITIIPKILLTSNDEMAVAAGMAIALPTADNSEAFGTNGARIISIENESVHLVPFLAFLYTPQGSDCFMQAFVTLDVDLNGNAVNADVGTGNLQQIGVWNDQNLGSGSFSFGKYLYQNYSRNSRVKSFSLLSELHYTGTVNDADTINSGPFLLGTTGRDLSLLNGTFGGTLRLKDSTVTGGYTVPLTSSDRIFDGEFRLFINQFF